MTKRLFWEDFYMKEFDSNIVSIEENRVVLGDTCFYPESGGQIGDTGYLNDVRVVDTQYSKSKKSIYHIVEDPKRLQKGQTVHGQIDWERRYIIMRHHTALHIVYYAFVEAYGNHKVVGSQVRDDKARVDFDFHEDIDAEAIEKRTNEILQSNLEIRCYGSSDDEKYRYWEIAGFEKMPDGATHPANTSEVGLVHVKKKSLGKQGVRLYVTTLEE